MKKCRENYFMEDEREASRLTQKVDPEKLIGEHFSAYIQSGMNVLDVGCGPGVIACAIGSRYADVSVSGVDTSESRLSEARKNCRGIKGMNFKYGHADSLPFANNQFDFVYSRFLIEYLPDPNAAVCEMVRVCRPGGRIFLQDLDGQLLWHYPIQKDLGDRIDQVLSFLKKSGFDPFVGRKLFFLLRRNGLKDIDITVVPYHLYAGKIGEVDFKLWELKLDIAKPQITLALGSEAEAMRLISDFLFYLQREDTLTYSNLFTVSGTV